MTGTELNSILDLNAEHALYREDGKWYHHLKKFPGVLFDKNGYFLFKTANSYLNNKELQHGIDLHIKNGISSLKGYKLYSIQERRSIIISGKIDIDEETIRVLRQSEVIKRKIRLVKKIKNIYDNTCQICETKLKIRDNVFYSEVHHIIPLGSPYNGSDKIENMICVCPNHHILLDLGAIPINLNNNLISKHIISEEFISFYMAMIFNKMK